MSASAASGGVAVGIIDPESGAAVVVQCTRYMLHAGKLFVADLVDESMGDTDTIVLAFKTPPVVGIHLFARYSTLVGAKLEVFEGATWTAQSGSSVPIINRRRTGTPPSSAILADQAQAGFVAGNVMHANPTGLNVGAATVLHAHYSWGVRNQSAAGEREEEELHLKASTQYAVRMTAIGASNKCQVILNWGENGD